MTFFGQTPAEPTTTPMRNWTYTSADGGNLSDIIRAKLREYIEQQGTT